MKVSQFVFDSYEVVEELSLRTGTPAKPLRDRHAA